MPSNQGWIQGWGPGCLGPRPCRKSPHFLGQYIHWHWPFMELQGIRLLIVATQGPDCPNFCPPSQLCCGRGILDYPPSVLPSVRPFPLNNFKSYCRNLMISHTQLYLGSFRRPYQGCADWPILWPTFGPLWPILPWKNDCYPNKSKSFHRKITFLGIHMHLCKI